jgi:hypothetical protein
LEIIIPNLKFSEVSNTVDENGNIHFPWIGEYLKAVYRFGVSIASILGVVMIIREGLRIVLSAGGEEKVTGYKHIGRVCMGLCLAWFSYVILFNINSDLVSFQALKIKLVDNLVAADDADEITDSEAAADIQIKKNSVNQTYAFKQTDFKAGPQPKWKSGQFTLDLCKEFQDPSFQNDPNAPSYGAVGNVISYTCPDIVGGTIKSIAPMQPALCRAGEIAKQKGYTLMVASSFRPFKDQVNIYCDTWIRDKRKPDSDLIATPGYSNHGRGIAVDVALFKNGQRVSWVNSKWQCSADEKLIRDLGEIFITADPDNFSRLESEIWHYEYSANNIKNRIRSNFTYPARCHK